MNVFIDSDVLIWHLRGKTEARDFLLDKSDEIETELCIGAMQRAEIVFFMREEEREDTLELLSLFKTVTVDQSIMVHRCLLKQQRKATTRSRPGNSSPFYSMFRAFVSYTRALT